MEGRGPVARTRCGKAGSGLRAGTRLSQALQHVRAKARHDRDKSRMRKSRTSGSVRGERRESRPYLDMPRRGDLKRPLAMRLSARQTPESLKRAERAKPHGRPLTVQRYADKNSGAAQGPDEQERDRQASVHQPNLRPTLARSLA